MITAETVSSLVGEAHGAIASATSQEALEETRQSLLGKKGSLTVMMKALGSVSPEERKEFGALLNRAKSELETLLTERRAELVRRELEEKLQSEWIDVTLPVEAALPVVAPGSIHPLTQVQRRVEEIFRGLGFSVMDGPEVEREYYNFEALNVPATHPARDMQDTFWNQDGSLLRAHTSSIQVRTLEKYPPPLRIIAPGRVFRYERIDATHEHTFYQLEGMMVDRNVTVGNLVYFLRTLLRELFGGDPKVRIRPGYFPFVEPGMELDVWFRGRWLELIGCGLVHPRVLQHGGIDPKEWQGFAFGLGLNRLVMALYEIDDIRHFQGGDLRFLRQF